MAKTKTTEPISDADLRRLSDGTFVLNFSLGSISTRARVKRDKVEVMATALRRDQEERSEVEADVESITRDDADDLKVSKELLRVPEIAALMKEMHAARATVRRGAQPVEFLRGGLYLYSALKVEWAERVIAESQEKMDALVARLDEKWPRVLADDERRLKPLGLWDPRDYPTVAAIGEKAKIRYSWLKFGVPAALERINPEVFRAEREKAKAMWSETFEAIRLARRAALQGLLDRVKGALVPGEDGKKRVLRQATIDNLNEALDSFRVDDVTNDADCAAVVDRIRAAMRGVDAEVLRTEEAAAGRVAQSLTEIGEALAPMVVEQQRRVQLRD